MADSDDCYIGAAHVVGGKAADCSRKILYNDDDGWMHNLLLLLLPLSALCLKINETDKLAHTWGETEPRHSLHCDCRNRAQSCEEHNCRCGPTNLCVVDNHRSESDCRKRAQVTAVSAAAAAAAASSQHDLCEKWACKGRRELLRREERMNCTASQRKVWSCLEKHQQLTQRCAGYQHLSVYCCCSHAGLQRYTDGCRTEWPESEQNCRLLALYSPTAEPTVFSRIPIIFCSLPFIMLFI